MLLLSADRKVQPVARSNRQLAATHKCWQYIPTLGAAPTRQGAFASLPGDQLIPLTFFNTAQAS